MTGKLKTLTQTILQYLLRKFPDVASRQELIQSRKKWQHLFANLPGGSYVVNKDYIIEDVNDVLCQVSGYTREELIGAKCNIICPKGPHKCPIFDLGIKYINNSQTAVKTKNGTLEPIIKSARVIPIDDHRELIVENFQSIRELQETQKELEYTRNYLNHILNAIQSIVIAVDDNMIVTHWNKLAQNFSGIYEEYAQHKHLFSIAPMLTPYAQEIDNVLRKKQPLFFFRKQLKANSNQQFNIGIYPLIHSDQKGVVIRIDDITYEEQKERELQHAQKMKSIGLLTSGIAHDFNNILGGITGTLSLIDLRLQQGEFDDDFVSDIETLKKSADRATEMVHQLQKLSNKEDIDFSTINLRECIEQVIKICKNTFDKSIDIQAQAVDSNCMIFGIGTQIEQVLLNICINAMHAMTIMRSPEEPHGGTLTIQTELVSADEHFCHIHPMAVCNQQYWMLEVSDTGIGIDPEDLTHIYEPFFSTKKKDTGSGIGLTMVFNIVKRHNGFINIQSIKEQGTTFQLFFPKSKNLIPNKPENTKIQSQNMQQDKQGLILIIDDEEIICRTAKNLLEKSGYRAQAVMNGEQGLNIIKANKEAIHTVLLDLIMPGRSGRAIFYDIQKINPQIRVIMTSGMNNDPRIAEILKAGGAGFIKKPYTLQSLAKQMHQLEAKQE